MGTTKTLAAAALMAIGSAAVPANAADYVIDYTSIYTVFHAAITTTDTADADGFFTITSMTATRNGAAATLLPAGNLYSDRKFKPTDPFLNDNGFTYQSGTDWINVFNSTLNDNGVEECFAPVNEQYDCVVNSTAGFTVRTVTTNPGVPEPATWAMMLLGLGAIGGMVRRGRQVRVRFA